MTMSRKINAYRNSVVQKVQDRHIQNPMFVLRIGQSVTDYLNSDDSIYSQIQRLETICNEFGYTKDNKRAEREKILQHAYLGCVITALDNYKDVYGSLGKYVDGIKESFDKNDFNIATTVTELVNRSFK